MGHTLRYSIDLPAPPQRVWSRMLDDATYRDWTSAFCPGSYYRGEWRTGATMAFLGPDQNGMRALIECAEEPVYLSIQHLGELQAGAPSTEPDWVGTFERYQLQALPDNGTRLRVTLTEVPEEWRAMMDTSWPLALERLRALCTD